MAEAGESEARRAGISIILLNGAVLDMKEIDENEKESRSRKRSYCGYSF